MSRRSPIEWVRGEDGSEGSTWNPLVTEERLAELQGGPKAANRWACTKKSPGCDNCYASTLNVRYGGTEFAPIGAKEPNAKVTMNYEPRGDSSITAPDRWKHPTTIFVCSMTDWAGQWVEPIWQEMMLDVAWRNPRHTFQFLTKRPDVSLKALDRWLGRNGLDIAPPHMWFGTTIEMGSLAWRAEQLGRHRASVRFVSAEPLIGFLDLSKWLAPHPLAGGCAVCSPLGACRAHQSAIDWIIVGGESGAGARPMHPDWARTLIAQAQSANVPVFVKQWGNWSPERPHPATNHGPQTITFDRRGVQWTADEPQHWSDPRWTTMYRHPSKHSAGRTIDGRTWDQMPDRPWMREAVAA